MSGYRTWVVGLDNKKDFISGFRRHKITMKKSSLLVFLPHLLSLFLVMAALIPSQAAKKYTQAG